MAETAAHPGLTVPHQQRYDNASARMLRLALAAAGIGAAGRGLWGLKKTLFPQPGVKGLNDTSVLRFPRRDEEEEDGLAKMAAAVGEHAAKQTEKQADPVADAGKAFNSNIWSKIGPQWNVPKPMTQSPMGIPLTMALAGGGLYGGYKLIDMLLNRQEKRKSDKSLRNARRDYEGALAEQYETGHPKTAAADTAIDFGDLYEKSAEPTPTTVSDIGQTLKNTAGTGSGLYLAALAALGIGAGKMTYDWSSNRDQRKAVDKEVAKERRRRLTGGSRPLVAMSV